MAFVNDRDRAAIRAAIGTAEAKTCGEIVCVITGACDSYLFIPTLWAAGVALGVPVAALAIWDALTPQVYLAQLLTFLVLSLAARWRPLTMFVVPGRVAHHRAAARARVEFLERGVSETDNRCGILIFVSIAERYVEIIADKGIYEKVTPDVWEQAVDKLLKGIRSGQIGDGFVAAIEDCGRVLQQHFPRQGGEIDELPNHLFEI